MLTDNSFLKIGKSFPPDCAKHRLERYKANKDIFEDKHEKVYKEQFRRIDRVIGNFSTVVSYATILNYQKLISIKIADLVFGEPPQITIKDNQDLINQIILDTDLFNKLYMSVIDISRYGDTIFMISDNGVDVIAPSQWFPVVNEYNMRTFKAHVFAYIYIIEKNENKIKYGLKVQIHNVNVPEQCEEHTYSLSGQPGSFKIEKELTNKKELMVETNLNSCPVFRIANLLTSDRLFGIDDYRSIDSIIAELMVRISQISKVLDKFASPSMTGPQSALDFDEQLQQWVLKVGDYFPRNTEEDPKPEYLVWDAGMEANFKQIELLINQLYMISEMGSAIFGDLNNKTGDVPSGTALRRLMMSPLAKARRIANHYDVPLKKMLALLAEQRGISINASDITIKWNDGLPADPSEDAEIANIRTGGKATLSQLTAIKRLDNMSDNEADLELSLIRADETENTIGTYPANEPESVLNEEF